MPDEDPIGVSWLESWVSGAPRHPTGQRAVAATQPRIQRAAVDPRYRGSTAARSTERPTPSPGHPVEMVDLGPVSVPADSVRMGSLTHFWVRGLDDPDDETVEWMLRGHGQRLPHLGLVLCDASLNGRLPDLPTDHLFVDGVYVHPEDREWTLMVGCVSEKRYRARNNPDAYLAPPPDGAVVEVLGQPALRFRSRVVLFLDDDGWPAHMAPVGSGSPIERSAKRMLGRSVGPLGEWTGEEWESGWSIPRDDLSPRAA